MVSKSDRCIFHDFDNRQESLGVTLLLLSYTKMYDKFT